MDMSRAVGYPMDYSHPAEIYDELARLSPKFSGISHDPIDREGGRQWPCTTEDHPGTPTLHGDGPLNGTAEFQPISYRPSAELPDPEYPFLLSTGRTLYHYNVGVQTRKSIVSNIRQPRNFVEMHPRDIRQMGFEDGQEIRVLSRRGEVKADVKKTRRVSPGNIWMPFHYAESCTNLLTNDAGDPITDTGEYKVCAVRLECVAIPESAK